MKILKRMKKWVKKLSVLQVQSYKKERIIQGTATLPVLRLHKAVSETQGGKNHRTSYAMNIFTSGKHLSSKKA
jgi:hypothetical protein